ncbi:MAG: hypothetical protein ACTSRI_20240 [Promethearchaeota archaeon]
MDYSDKEIFQELGFKNNDYDPGVPSRALRSIAGLTEIQRRNSRKFSRWSIILTVAVIILSLVAIYFSYNAYRTSIDWQERQLELLEEIKNNN